MHPFREAVERGDIDALPGMLAEDVVFLSPVAFTPYTGRAMVGAILRGVARVFEDMRYVREFADESGRGHALVFKAWIGDREIHGCDFLRTNDEGLIEELCVMVRPLSAARALADAMGAQFETIRREALTP
ncbi:nuclear transport factor 2 family protein [Actinomadura keratinilytica]|uniref:Nuclear transport factor 2 family protein n=1 Tax=Actinomadura keratinilytica TaxID=547461 RepID=A0ABP7ZAZ4_9ACTN